MYCPGHVTGTASAPFSPLSHSHSPSSSHSLYIHRSYRSLSTSTSSMPPSRQRDTRSGTHNATPRPQVVLYLRQDGRGRVGHVCIHHPPSRHALGMGREAHLGAPDLVGNGSTMHLGNTVSTHMHQGAEKAHCSASIIHSNPVLEQRLQLKTPPKPEDAPY